MTDKQADLAGPGISTYEEVAKILPTEYESLLTPKETMKALFGVKNYIEENLCRELNLMMVQVPLIVDRNSGVNDMLDRDGSRTPVEFPCGLGLDRPMDAQVVQAATKWKRMALRTFDCDLGEGICTDMKAIRKDYFLDHDHSAYVDQWDWEKSISADQRSLDFLTGTVRKIWKVMVGALQLSRQRVRPAVVGTNDRVCPEAPACLRAQHGAAVTAGVVEGLEPSVGVAGYEDVLATDLDDLVLAGFR